MRMSTFASLGLSAPLLKATDVLGFKETTPVQAQSIPPMLSGKDVIAKARTGSGKTVAFALGLLSRTDVSAGQTQALILCPTRELADQVAQEIRKLARFIANTKVVTLCGGVPARHQVSSLRRAPLIVVGTPGRVLDHLKRETLFAHGLRVFVLDEADRMLDMGFSDAIKDIESRLSKRKQTLLFSATFPDEIREISARYQSDPVSVSVDNAPSAQIEEHFYKSTREQKVDDLVSLLAHHRPASALVFCNTRIDTKNVAEALSEKGASTLALHGDMEQYQRDETLIRFANKSARILCATDVAARGLDVKKLEMVVSYEIAHETDVHQHRIGRTGRAGESGIALSLVAKREAERVIALEKKRGTRIHYEPLPEFDDTHARKKILQPAEMITVKIDGGKKDKLRAGDLLGALTGDMGLHKDVIGKFNILPTRTYVAIRREAIRSALAALQKHKIKGRSFRVRRIG